MQNKIFIIEHLEPKLWKWCSIEYKHISKIVGRGKLWFTNIQNASEKKKLARFGNVFAESVKEMHLKQACVLDPTAKRTLTHKQAKHFNYFVFGGILGNSPPRKRTKNELTKFMKNAESFNIGKKQMSTDNAVYVVKQIISGKKLSNISFKDKIEVPLKEFESVILPYRYAVVNRNLLISKELIDYLKRKKGL